MIGERFACDGKASHVRPVLAVGDTELEETGRTKRLDQRPAILVEVAGRFGQPLGAPVLKLVGKHAMVRLEEWPGKEAAVGHQSPLNTGVCFAAKAS